jgi:hypothetical protein
LCTSLTNSTAAAPFSWAASVLRHALDGSDVTTPSNGLFGSRSRGSWSSTSTIRPFTSPW